MLKAVHQPFALVCYRCMAEVRERHKAVVATWCQPAPEQTNVFETDGQLFAGQFIIGLSESC
jgi:hypothetical protein